MNEITELDQSELRPDRQNEQSKNESNAGIPKHVLDAIVDTMLRDIIAFFETEEGQREFDEWKAEREREYNAHQGGRMIDKSNDFASREKHIKLKLSSLLFSISEILFVFVHSNHIYTIVEAITSNDVVHPTRKKEFCSSQYFESYRLFAVFYLLSTYLL